MDGERTGPKRGSVSFWGAVAVVAAVAVPAAGGGAYWASAHGAGGSAGQAPAAPIGGAPSGGQPGGGPSMGSHTMRIESYTASGSALTVHFWGGVCTAYTATAAESSDRVTVRVAAAPGRPGRMCSMIARQFARTVRLDRPLGGRRVIDAWDGATLPMPPSPARSAGGGPSAG